MVRSFSEPLCKKLHNFFPSHLKWDRMVRVDWTWVFLFHWEIDSDKTPAGQALVNYFLLKAGLVKKSASVKKCVLFPPPARSTRRLFSSIDSGNLAKLLEV